MSDDNEYRIGHPLAEPVFQTLGATSMCWSEIPSGVFDSERAARLGEELMTKILEREAAITESAASAMTAAAAWQDLAVRAEGMINEGAPVGVVADWMSDYAKALELSILELPT